MPSDTIERIQATEFATTVHALADQKKSRLRSMLDNTVVFAGDDYALDTIGVTNAREIVGRYEAVTFDSPDWGRRQLARRRFAVTYPIDKSDVRGSFQSIIPELSQQCVAAMNKEFDRVITKAAFADVLTASSGKNFDTLVSFASDGGVTVDATAGLTRAKLIEIHQNFMDKEVGVDEDERLWLQITGDENTSLINETTLTSRDFTSINTNANDSGMVKSGHGIEFVFFGDGVSNPIVQRNSSGTERELVAASSKGIRLGISQDIKVKIEDRSDLYETMQVVAILEIGAVRVEGARVQKVRVTV